MGFVYGRLANKPEVPPIEWDPDSSKSINPHMLCCGGSGSGKTTFLLKIINYLESRKKHIFIFDLKGDMVIKNSKNETIGNYIDFTAWNSEYGINPFEFIPGVSPEELSSLIKTKTEPNKEQWYKIRNAGPKVQVDRFVEIFRKNFLPNMGAGQKAMLNYLLTDTYKLKGFRYDDFYTWENDLPSLEDTLELIKQLKLLYSGESQILTKKDIQFILKCKKNIRENFTNKDESEDNNLESLDELFHKYIYKEKMQHSKNLSDGEFDAKQEQEDIDKSIESTIDLPKLGIELENYSSKDSIRAVLKLEFYIKSLVDSGVFHSNRPPVKPGLNIVNISGLGVEIQRFIVDVWLGKVFRSCKIRGTYKDLQKRPRGAKCDTFVVIDESKLVAGKEREKKDPYSYLNRIATEARGFGLGIIVAAQSAEHFPPEFLKNFDSQIILNTGIADFDSVRKSFGVSEGLLEFTQQGWGRALVKTGRMFSKIYLTSEEKQ